LSKVKCELVDRVKEKEKGREKEKAGPSRAAKTADQGESSDDSEPEIIPNPALAYKPPAKASNTAVPAPVSFCLLILPFFLLTSVSPDF
jgi:hypothetical protein